MKRRQPVRQPSRVLQFDELRTIRGGLPLFRELIQRIEGDQYLHVEIEDCLVSSY